MIVCPNCNHQNPGGAVQCEACYTPLPAMAACPRCGADVQADASFCGQCGLNLKNTATSTSASSGQVAETRQTPAPPSATGTATVAPPPRVPSASVAEQAEPEVAVAPPVSPSPPLEPESTAPEVVPMSANPAAAIAPPAESRTQLQQQTARLLHVQTNLKIELPQNLSLIHLGKPNDRVPPDIDVSGFPNSEIVSRIHADIRIEGDAYYVEDVGSSNGTYINNMPLPMGNRHRLRPGDRISLGKGDKVTFLFQLS